MGFAYGLAVVLVIFEGIMNQCEGTEMGEGSHKRIRVASGIDIKDDLPFMPNDLIELIISKTDYKTIHRIIRSRTIRVTSIIMSRILQHSIISFMPEFNDEKIIEDYELGDSFLRISNYQTLNLFFKRFGDQVKKIEIDLGDDSNIQSEEIIENCIRKCAKNLEELRITGSPDKGFWEKISDGENVIIFPEVRKFRFWGQSNHSVLKLNLMFPALESVKLLGDIADVNCLANVRKLKELTLETSSIKEDQFDGIFKNNENMRMISLLRPNRTETMQSIAKHLTKLKIFAIYWPGDGFLLRANNSPKNKLPSVNQFNIIFDQMVDIFGIGDLNLSFDMPHLKKLTLYGDQTDDRIIQFIQHFGELEIFELFTQEYGAVKCIEKLKRIKEFTTIFHETGFDFLKKMFENFDETSKLQTLKLIKFDQSLYKTYENTMEAINIHLKSLMKSTWTLSHGKQIGIDEQYLMFRREP